MKLYTNAGNFRAMKALVAAQYNGVAIEIPEFEMMKDNVTPEFLAKSPMGKVPCLETSEGSIFGSNAIARYVARIRGDTELCGRSFFDSASVDSWVDFCAYELELGCVTWVYPVFGFMPFSETAQKTAEAQVAKALATLEAHLVDKTFLVGEAVTLADIVIVSTLLYPMKLVLDKAFLKPYPCVTRWFTTCVNQAEFKAVMGTVALCNKRLFAEGDKAAAAAAPKKQEKKQKASSKKEKEKKSSDPDPLAAPAPAKKVDPLAGLKALPKSKMSLDAWKTHYSNPQQLKDGKGTVKDTLPWFFENFDSEGWSMWFSRYKYNDDNKMVFMTCNAAEGFIQRCEILRKFSMGAVYVSGEEGKELLISGLWLMRGQEIKYMLDQNPDAEYYDWIKMDFPFSDANKAAIEDFWKGEDEDGATVEGRPVQFLKIFK
jgi:elongation factor 1-gamma